MSIYANVAELKAASRSEMDGYANQNVWTACYTTPTNGGGGKYLIVPKSSFSGAPDGRVNFYVGSSNYIAVLQYNRFVNAKQAGITTGLSDVADPIEAVLKAGFPLYVSSGKYTWRNQCNVKGYDINMEGDPDTIFDITDYRGPSGGWVMDTGGTGSSTDHGRIPEDWDRQMNALRFPSGVSASPNQVFMIHDPTNHSFQPYRKYMKKGEYIRINNRVSSGVYSITSALYDSYSRNTARLYTVRMNKVILKNLRWESDSAEGRASGNNLVYGLRVHYSHMPFLENIIVKDGVMAGCLTFTHVYEGMHINCQGKTGYDDMSLSYGCKNSSVQDSTYIGGRYEGVRTGLGHGRSPHQLICNRNISYIACQFSSHRFPLDQHGTTEFCNYIGCDCAGGFQLGARGTKVIGCTFRAHHFHDNPSSTSAQTALIYGEEVIEYNHIFEGNTFIFNGPATGQPIIALKTKKWGDPMAYTQHIPGTFVFKDNIIHNDAGGSTLTLIVGTNDVGSYGTMDTSDASVVIQGNSLSGPQTAASVNMSYIKSGLKQIVVVDNAFGTINESISGVGKKTIRGNY